MKQKCQSTIPEKDVENHSEMAVILTIGGATWEIANMVGKE